MTQLAKKNETALLIKSREQALAEIVGQERIKAFMGNCLAQLQPTNAQGKPNGLLKCSPQSFYAAAHQAAILGLQPGPLEEVYMVPYKTKASLIIGYKGMLELSRRHPDVLKVTAKCIYKDDDIQYNEATGEIHHTSSLDSDRSDGKIVGAYCRAVIRNCEEPISLVMSIEQIEKRRKRSAAANGNFWTQDYAAMARKTVIRALFNGGELPRSTQMAAAVEFEHQEEKRTEILSTKTEHPAHVATEVEIGFSEPDYHHVGDGPGDDADNFGLDQPEVTDERSDLLNQITKQAIRLKLKPSEVFDIVTEMFGEVVKSLDDMALVSLQEVLSEMEGRS